jgi:phosphoribosylglycinamide formyltransferase 2
MTSHAEDADHTGRSAVPVVMLLGSGEMSRELTLAFQRLGAAVVAVDRCADAPAHRIADRCAVVTMNDPEALAAVIDEERPDFVVVEAGAVATDVLGALAERTEVFPTPRATRLSLDREGLRRLAADELGLPTAPFWFAGSAEELAVVAEHAGFPLAVTPVAGAPGEGSSVLLRPEDVEPAWNRAIAAGHLTTPNRVMAETVVDVEDEITLLTVRRALLRAHRAPGFRGRHAGDLAAAPTQPGGARRCQVHRRPHRGFARRARRVRGGTAGARRRGVLLRRRAAAR